MQGSTLFKEIVNELKISDGKLFSQNIYLPNVQVIDNLLKNNLFINLFKEYRNKLVISNDPQQIKNQLKSFFYKIVGNQTQSGGVDHRSSFRGKQVIRNFAEELERQFPGISILVVALILICMLLKSVYESNSNPEDPIAQQIFDILSSVLGTPPSNTGGKKRSKKHRKSKIHRKSKKRSKKLRNKNRRKSTSRRH